MDPCELTIVELGSAYRDGSLSPVEATEAYLARIESENETTRDYITVTGARARADARTAEDGFRAGRDLGPLQGVPIGLKDLVDTKGIRTTAGSLVWAERVPEEDATIAHRLACAGTVLLGKTNLVEFAFGPYGINPHYGTPPNPWKAECVPGGSSSGSGGAVGRGLAVATIGTDTGGSIRVPASFCGVVGLKPTVQRVSRAGVVPLSWTLDSVGPLAKTVRDAALVFDAISGPDPADPVTEQAPAASVVDGLDDGVQGLRVGMAEHPFCDNAEDDVMGRFNDACEDLAGTGVTVEPFSFPEAREEFDAELSKSGSIAIMCVEGYTCYAETLRTKGATFDERITARIEAGAEYTGEAYANALRAHDRLRRAAARRLETVDAVVVPTTLYPAPKIADVAVAPARLTTRLVNFLGLCAVSVPCGFSDDGLPLGLQIIGKPFDEATILKLAHAYEQSTTWHKHRPE